MSAVGGRYDDPHLTEEGPDAREEGDLLEVMQPGSGTANAW